MLFYKSKVRPETPRRANPFGVFFSSNYIT
nr:MAG TPA: hypothetical protein [Caudoviricetes sp.]